MYLCIAERETEYDHCNGGRAWHEEIEIFSSESRVILLAMLAEWKFNHRAFNVESRNDDNIRYKFSPIYTILNQESVTDELLQSMGAYQKYVNAKKERASKDKAFAALNAKKQKEEDLKTLARLKAQYPGQG